MEHRLTIPQIAAFLHENGLEFLGFELDPQSVARFRTKHPDRAALTNLDYWHAFEQANPDTFHRMYVFDVARKHASLAHETRARLTQRPRPSGEFSDV
jgi:hypothetical protein